MACKADQSYGAHQVVWQCHLPVTWKMPPRAKLHVDYALALEAVVALMADCLLPCFASQRVKEILAMSGSSNIFCKMDASHMQVGFCNDVCCS